jgi:arsenate reductase-like glutaredoxin family protein
MAHCEKCDLLEASLKRKNVPHRSFNIVEDPFLYKRFIAFITKVLNAQTRIKFPIIWKKDHPIFGYENSEEVLEKLVS